MNSGKKWWLALGGAVAIAVVVGAGVVMAQTPSSTPTAPANTAPGASGTPHSNEDATHEAGEDPTREAAEDSGQFRGGKHGGRHGSNEDATHEANESADREAAENAAASATPGTGN